MTLYATFYGVAQAFICILYVSKGTNSGIASLFIMISSRIISKLRKDALHVTLHFHSFYHYGQAIGLNQGKRNTHIMQSCFVKIILYILTVGVISNCSLLH